MAFVVVVKEILPTKKQVSYLIDGTRDQAGDICPIVEDLGK